MLSRESNLARDGSTEAVFHSPLRLLGLVRQVMDPYFLQFGISASQWAILRVLQRAEAQNERSLPLKELGQRLYIQPPSVTGVVDRLERQGLVQRTSSPADRRVRLIRLTSRGRKLVTKAKKGHGEQISLLFAGLGVQELRELRHLLVCLEEHLQTLIPGGPHLVPVENEAAQETKSRVKTGA